MTSEIDNRQILSLAQQGIGAGEIAAALELEEPLVRLVLNAHKAGSAADRDINDEQLGLLRQKAFSLAMQDEDPNLAGRMTMFLIERDKPRDRIPASPIASINNALIVANESFAKLLESYK